MPSSPTAPKSPIVNLPPSIKTRFVMARCSSSTSLSRSLVSVILVVSLQHPANSEEASTSIRFILNLDIMCSCDVEVSGNLHRLIRNCSFSFQSLLDHINLQSRVNSHQPAQALAIGIEIAFCAAGVDPGDCFLIVAPALTKF